MEARVAEIAAGTAPELVWLVEHPPLYTAGTSANLADVLDARFPVFESGRGGQMTYHGPGQRVGYVMLDLRQRGPDVRRFVATLEEWIIRTLARFNVRGERREDRIGVWVKRPDKGEVAIRGQDRRARHSRQAMGDAARHRHQCGAGAFAFLRHRAVRGERATLWRHQPGRSRHSGVDGGSRYGAERRVRGIVRRRAQAVGSTENVYPARRRWRDRLRCRRADRGHRRGR